MDAPLYTVVEMTPEQVAQEREVYGGLAQSVRALNDACLRTTVAAAEVEEVRARLDELTARLTAEQIPGAAGVTFTPDGTVRGHGNAVVGMRNPLAVPLQISTDDDGRASASFHLGALYEGPPGCVHGGVLALVLDQVFGESAASGGAPGMTGTLTLRYLRPTPLGDCSARAWVDRVEGVKTIVKGEFHRADGTTTVEAEGIFVMPRWVREQMAQEGLRPPRFE